MRLVNFVTYGALPFYNLQWHLYWTVFLYICFGNAPPDQFTKSLFYPSATAKMHPCDDRRIELWSDRYIVDYVNAQVGEVL